MPETAVPTTPQATTNGHAAWRTLPGRHVTVSAPPGSYAARRDKQIQEQVCAVGRRLKQDAALREQFQANPIGTLREQGLSDEVIRVLADEDARRRAGADVSGYQYVSWVQVGDNEYAFDVYSDDMSQYFGHHQGTWQDIESYRSSH